MKKIEDMTSAEIRKILAKKEAEEKAALEKSYLTEDMYRLDVVERVLSGIRQKLNYDGSLLSIDDLETLKERLISSIDSVKNDDPYNYSIVRKGTAMIYDEDYEQWEVLDGYGYFNKNRGKKHLKKGN